MIQLLQGQQVMGIFSKINPKDLTVALFDGSLRLLEQPNFNLTRLKTNLAGKTLGGVESGGTCTYSML